MLLQKKQTQKFFLAGGTVGWLYPDSPKKDQTIAYVEMSGVYPAQGYSINDFCTETICLIEGKFEAEVDGEKFTIQAGDVLMILPGKKYRLRGKGKSFDFITPAWKKEQNHIIEE